MGKNSLQEIEALPRDEEGHTYITDQMLVEAPEVARFWERTRSSWWRDELRCRYVLFPTVGKS